MALEKSIQARRKAQQLAREGKVQQAIDEMRKLLSEGEVDPYDHVYIGDLLIRVGQLSDAIDSWLLSVRHYEQAGLNRNAIAICKKILRLDPRRHTVHRVLGDLYVLDGLWGEAVPHFLVYLDSVNGDECFGPTFLETLEKAVSVVGLQVEAALRLADHYTRVGRGDRAADLLSGIAAQLEESGAGPEIAEELRSRAREARAQLPAATGGDGGSEEEVGQAILGADEVLCADLEARGTEPWPAAPAPPRLAETMAAAPATEPAGEPLPLPAEVTAEAEPGLAGAGGTPDEAAALPSLEPVEPPPGAPEFVVEHLGALDFGPARASAPATAGAEAGAGSATGPDAQGPDDPISAAGLGEAGTEAERVWDLDEAASPTVLEWPDDEETPATETPEVPVAEVQAASLAVAEETSRGPAGLLDRAESAFQRRDWLEAQRLFERALAEHPLDPQSLGRLVEVARELGDTSAQVRYLILLGDAWIEAGEMEKAVVAFLEVHRIDPENGTARRRIARFREMGVPGADGAEAPNGVSVRSILNRGDACVTVADASRADAPTQDWMELGALLEAFQEGLKNQIAGDDYQSHYDLAVSHRAMGLLDEAIDEADQALQCEGVPSRVECLARELKGLCLSELERHREAVHEFRAALEQSMDDAGRRRSLRYRLAVALESVGEWQEAAEAFEAVVSDAPDYLDAAERREFCLRAWVAAGDQEEKAA